MSDEPCLSLGSRSSVERQRRADVRVGYANQRGARHETDTSAATATDATGHNCTVGDRMVTSRGPIARAPLQQPLRSGQSERCSQHSSTRAGRQSAIASPYTSRPPVRASALHEALTHSERSKTTEPATRVWPQVRDHV